MHIHMHDGLPLQSNKRIKKSFRYWQKLALLHMLGKRRILKINNKHIIKLFLIYGYIVSANDMHNFV